MTTTTPDRSLDAWTARAFAEAVGVPTEIAEQVLEDTVRDGLAVRISFRDVVVYVPGDLVQTLTRADVFPVTAAERGAMVRQLVARERARRLIAGDEKGGNR